jgi:hypothetical protein
MGLALLAYDTSCISAVASSMTATGDHGAGSCAPNRYQAVPSQRAIEVGNFLGNSKSPTALRL